MTRRFRHAAAVFVLAVLSVAPPVAGESGLDTPLPVDSAVRLGKLANGLTYYIRENRTPAERAELRLVVNAGSVLETDAQQGLAHFVEHMAFNGTEGFGKSQIVDYLESIGMRFGPEINAYTGFDETVYMLEVPTDQPAIVETAFRILSEWAFRVSFEPEEVDKERGVIVEEWRLGRGADGRVQDKQFPLLLAGSRYAERLPIGKREVVETAPVSQITSFYRDWYRPDLMAVIAVGDFDAAAIEALVRLTFGPFAVPAGAPRRPELRVPDHQETLYSVVTDPELTMTVVSLYAGRDVEPFVTVGDYRKRIVSSLTGMMLSGRLDELARQSDPPFLQAYAGVDRLVRTREAFTLAALVRDDGMQAGLEALLTEVERVGLHGFTETELQRARDDLMRGMESYFREQDKSTSRQFAEEYVRAYLTAEPIPGIEYEYELHARELPGIGLAEVNALAAKLLGQTGRVVLGQSPAKPGVRAPTEEELAAVFDRVRAATVGSYVDTATEGPLVASRPPGSRVVAERPLPALEAFEWTLANGVKVLLKPTTFRNDEVLFHAFSPGGTSVVDDADYVSALIATAVVAEAGLNGFSAADLHKKLAGTAVQASPWISELYEGLQGSASPREMETLLELVYLELTSARRDPASFDTFRAKYQAYLVNRRGSPETVFGDTVRSVLTQDAPRARPLTPESLAGVSLDRTLAVYQDRFGDAGDFVFVFVGNIDLEAIRPLVETWLGGLPSAGRRESWRDLGVDPPLSTVTATVHRGIESKSRVALRFAGDFPYSRDELIALIAAADILEIRLREQLREELSGTYSATVSASAQKYPDQEFQVGIDFGCDPARVEELTQAVFREIAWMRDGTVDESYLAKEREALRRGREESVRDNGFWLSSIASSLMNGEDPADVLGFNDRVRALDAEKIRRAARSYFTPARYVQVVLSPEGAR